MMADRAFQVIVGGKALSEKSDVAQSVSTGKQNVYVDTKDTAALVRAKLKKTYPWVKFGVRISRYSGGSSIHVSWTDGPTETMVRATCEEFRGDYFDGMIDYHGGIVREVDGQCVHYGGSLGYRRNVSKDTFLKVVEMVKAKYGADSVPTIRGLDTDCPWFDADYSNADARSMLFWANEIYRNAAVDAKGNVVVVKVKSDAKDAGNIVQAY